MPLCTNNMSLTSFDVSTISESMQSPATKTNPDHSMGYIATGDALCAEKHVHMPNKSMAAHPPRGTSSASRTLPWRLPMTPPVLPQGRSPANFYAHCPVLTKPGPTCRPTLLPGNPSDCKIPSCQHEDRLRGGGNPAPSLKTKSVKGRITVASTLV